MLSVREHVTTSWHNTRNALTCATPHTAQRQGQKAGGRLCGERDTVRVTNRLASKLAR